MLGGVSLPTHGVKMYFILSENCHISSFSAFLCAENMCIVYEHMYVCALCNVHDTTPHMLFALAVFRPIVTTQLFCIRSLHLRIAPRVLHFSAMHCLLVYRIFLAQFTVTFSVGIAILDPSSQDEFIGGCYYHSIPKGTLCMAPAIPAHTYSLCKQYAHLV